MELNIFLSFFAALYCFGASLILKNVSQVDKLWGIFPILYAWNSYATCQSARGLGGAILVSIWGLRLSFNFARKGGFSGEEDYRWGYLRKQIGTGWLWVLFNFGFISMIQNWIIVGFELPLHQAACSETPIWAGDYAAMGMILFFICFETVADQQQFNFQTRKYEMIRNKQELTGDYKRGFLTQGLFAYSRHPNFFGEIMVWWSVYLLQISATGIIFQWTLLGPLCLNLLIHFSTNFTEGISKGKYREYSIYSSKVSRLLPLPPSSKQKL